MYTSLPQRLRDLIDEIVELEVRIRELDNDVGYVDRRSLTIERMGICHEAFEYCKAHNLHHGVVNAAFFERLGRKVTDDGIIQPR